MINLRNQYLTINIGVKANLSSASVSKTIKSHIS